MRSETRRGVSPIKFIFWGTVGGIIAGASVLYFASKRHGRKLEQTPLFEAMESGEALIAVRRAPQLESAYLEMDSYRADSRDGNSSVSQKQTIYEVNPAARSKGVTDVKNDEFTLSEPPTRHARISFEESLASSRRSSQKPTSSDAPLSLKFAANENRIQEEAMELSIQSAQDFVIVSEHVQGYVLPEMEEETVVEMTIVAPITLDEETSYPWLEDAPTEKITDRQPFSLDQFSPTGLHDQDVSSCLKEGRKLCDSRKFLEAERSYQKMQQSYPEDARLFNALGTLYAEQGKYGDAEKSWLRAISLEPSTETYNFLGSIWEGQDRYDDAVEAYKKALDLNPGDIMSRSNLGWIYASQKKYSRARKEFQRNTESYSGEKPRELRPWKKRT